ncbi:hypothetical protein [Acidianus ambivalens]|uniref:Uncharacterized protein n=1 Tax=Acidianus ambivalens TaxID=2283 RepID=A0A650CUZ6_ACIAM|nr:hypothetical protein [Acidianus ambivalens]MQL55840.1 hypothetical protein [Acidianus ambivalens]QGR21593.1 hypothetical protein D1866_05995 [Acidianus ambivalens]
MNSIVDLDSDQCSYDPLEAIEYLKDKKEYVIFKISMNNPFLQDIKRKYFLQIIKVDGEIVYFKIQ